MADSLFVIEGEPVHHNENLVGDNDDEEVISDDEEVSEIMRIMKKHGITVKSKEKKKSDTKTVANDIPDDSDNDDDSDDDDSDDDSDGDGGGDEEEHDEPVFIVENTSRTDYVSPPKLDKEDVSAYLTRCDIAKRIWDQFPDFRAFYVQFSIHYFNKKYYNIDPEQHLLAHTQYLIENLK